MSRKNSKSPDEDLSLSNLSLEDTVDWDELEEVNAENATQEKVDDYLFKQFDSPVPQFFRTVSRDVRIEGSLHTHHKGDLVITFRDGSTLTLRESRYIERGGIGSVYEYTFGSIKYAVKIAIRFGMDGNERKAIMNLRRREAERNRNCSLISARIVECADLSVSLMPLMTGDLTTLGIFESKYSNALRRNMQISILETVRTQMNCLLTLNNDLKDMEFGYGDLKPDNVFFKRNSDGTITFCLGDIGSVVPLEDEKGKYLTSVFRLPYGESGSYSRIRSENLVLSMRFIFGVFATAILGINYRTPGSGEFVDYNLFRRKHSAESMQLYSKTLHSKVKSLRFPNPDSYLNLLWDENYETYGRKNLEGYIPRTDMY